MSPSLGKALPGLLLITLVLVGCGGGTNNFQPPPTAPTFTSTPVTAASEGVPYSYQLVATSPNSSSITFALTTAPTGAALSGSTISWTPTHAESRTSNAFTVTATAGAASSMQSWTVTPTGNVSITAVTTYWTPTGTSSALPTWLANLPYPAALVPQADGSLQRLPGAANPTDDSFTIPNVPGGYYWLQINPDANFWTSTSDFDYGSDFVGHPLTTTAQSTTTFDTSISGLTPSPSLGYFLTLTDLHSSITPAAGELLPNASTFSQTLPYPSAFDWTTVTTLYLSQYESVSTGSFSGLVLGPTQTLSNVSFTNGGANTITGVLSASPAAPLPLSIAGSTWASLAATSGPNNPTPAISDFSAFVEPYVTGRSATSNVTLQIGPAFTLLRPFTPTSPFVFLPPLYPCGIAVALGVLPPGISGNPPIVTDTDYRTISYDDPYPSSWQRNFQYCQLSNVTLPRPNSSATDTFMVGTSQITPLPNGPVTPILSSVQSPTLNGGSFFASATLNTTNVSISWNAPATGHPCGYYVSVFELVTNSSGTTAYTGAGTYATGKTSVNIPFLTANNIYVFSITAMSDSISNIELAPLRHQVPTARSGVISAPFVIAPGATSSAARVE